MRVGAWAPGRKRKGPLVETSVLEKVQALQEQVSKDMSAADALPQGDDYDPIYSGLNDVHHLLKTLQAKLQQRARLIESLP